ncbi:MAG: hypothetical protein KUG76_05075, partial [Gammaproteobacteria bacterium]|nr:hypothetical protein [Gammaproteobacteria bacterium]
RHNDFALTGGVVKSGKAPLKEQFTLQPGVEVKIQPTGIHGPFSFIVYDGNGFPLFNDRIRGAQRFGGEWSFRLLPNPHTIEVFCPKFESAPVEFRAEEGQALKVKLTPVK